MTIHEVMVCQRNCRLITSMYIRRVVKVQSINGLATFWRNRAKSRLYNIIGCISVTLIVHIGYYRTMVSRVAFNCVGEGLGLNKWLLMKSVVCGRGLKIPLIIVIRLILSVRPSPAAVQYSGERRRPDLAPLHNALVECGTDGWRPMTAMRWVDGMHCSFI